MLLKVRYDSQLQLCKFPSIKSADLHISKKIAKFASEIMESHAVRYDT